LALGLLCSLVDWSPGRQYLQQHAMRGHGHGQHGGHGQPSATPQGGALRFSPGDKVQCNVGGNQWKGGTIQQLWYVSHLLSFRSSGRDPRDVGVRRAACGIG